MHGFIPFLSLQEMVDDIRVDEVRQLLLVLASQVAQYVFGVLLRIQFLATVFDDQLQGVSGLELLLFLEGL